MTESQATGHSSYPHLSSPASGHSSCPHKFPQQLDTLVIRTKLSGSDARKLSNWTLQLSAQEFPSTEHVKRVHYSPPAPGNFPYIYRAEMSYAHHPVTQKSALEFSPLPARVLTAGFRPSRTELIPTPYRAEPSPPKLPAQICLQPLGYSDQTGFPKQRKGTQLLVIELPSLKPQFCIWAD